MTKWFVGAREGHRLARKERFGKRVYGGFGQMSAVGVRPPIGERLEALLERHSPGEPIVTEHARSSREAQAAEMLPGENGGGGVKDVKDALSLELGKRVDAVCELGVIVVACASNQVVGGEGASEACARVQQRGAREALPPRIPRAVANNRSSVGEPLALLIGEHRVKCRIGERNAESWSPLP